MHVTSCSPYVYVGIFYSNARKLSPVIKVCLFIVCPHLRRSTVAVITFHNSSQIFFYEANESVSICFEDIGEVLMKFLPYYKCSTIVYRYTYFLTNSSTQHHQLKASDKRFVSTADINKLIRKLHATDKFLIQRILKIIFQAHSRARRFFVYPFQLCKHVISSTRGGSRD